MRRRLEYALNAPRSKISTIRSHTFGKLGWSWSAGNVTPRDDADHVTGPSTTTVVVTRAYSYVIDPTPEQISMLRSHVGGSRFAYNTLLGLVKDN